MKKTILIAASLFVTTYSFANDEKSSPKDLPDCASIASQCEAAGFKAGAHESKKGIWLDCIKERATGKEVTGITATSEDAKRCLNASKSARKAKREARKLHKSNEKNEANE